MESGLRAGPPPGQRFDTSTRTLNSIGGRDARGAPTVLKRFRRRGVSFARALAQVLLLSGSLAEPRLARADETGPRVVTRLDYGRDKSASMCPEESAVRDIFKAQLGEEGISDKASSRLHVTVVARPGRRQDIEGRIELTGSDGKRIWSNDLRVNHDDCATLIASLALSFRVAEGTLEGLLRESTPVPAPRPKAKRLMAPVVIRGVPLPPAPGLAPPVPDYPSSLALELLSRPIAPSLGVWGSAAAVVGAAPSVPVRLALDVGFSWPIVSLFFELRGLLPAGDKFHDHVLQVSRLEGAFAPCFSSGVAFVCGLLSVGGLWAQIVGIHPDNPAQFHGTVGGRVGLNLSLTSNWGIAAYADVEGVFKPTTIVVDGAAPWGESAVQIAPGIAFTGGFPFVQQ